jgi:hypothetical protein
MQRAYTSLFRQNEKKITFLFGVFGVFLIKKTIYLEIFIGNQKYKNGCVKILWNRTV